MGNKLVISVACCTLEIASWNSHDHVLAALGLLATSISLVSVLLDSSWMQALANRCSGFDLPESLKRPLSE